jgi:hypothetical protein
LPISMASKYFHVLSDTVHHAWSCDADHAIDPNSHLVFFGDRGPLEHNTLTLRITSILCRLMDPVKHW